MKAFDKKFGAEFMARVPAAPGIYRIYDGQDQLIYVGKAKNLKRRLSQYRNAKRRKKHLKMRSIIQDADRIDFETCDSDLSACLRETELIQKHRPRWNVAGAFYFLYPMLGMKVENGYAYFCYTTRPELFPDFELHGAFRSRWVTREAFFALMELLEYIAHRMKRQPKRDPYSSVVGFRMLSAEWVEILGDFWRGESNLAIEHLVLALIENAGARRKKRDVQESLNLLKLFWKHEAKPLSVVIKKTGYLKYPVSQTERDSAFIRYRLEKR